MKTLVFWLGTFVAFGTVNGMIAHKEAMIRNGRTIYLELGPRDPRSLMQGDYMALRYELHGVRPDKWRGRFVVRVGADNIGRIIRVHDGERLAEDEHLLRYTRWSGGTRIGTDSFFFQEGHANHYTGARYGKLKVAPSGESVLVGLYNANLSPAGPPPAQPSEQAT